MEFWAKLSIKSVKLSNCAQTSTKGQFLETSFRYYLEMKEWKAKIHHSTRRICFKVHPKTKFIKLRKTLLKCIIANLCSLTPTSFEIDSIKPRGQFMPRGGDVVVWRPCADLIARLSLLRPYWDVSQSDIHVTALYNIVDFCSKNPKNQQVLHTNSCSVINSYRSPSSRRWRPPAGSWPQEGLVFFRVMPTSKWSV